MGCEILEILSVDMQGPIVLFSSALFLISLVTVILKREWKKFGFMGVILSIVLFFGTGFLRIYYVYSSGCVIVN